MGIDNYERYFNISKSVERCHHQAINTYIYLCSSINTKSHSELSKVMKNSRCIFRSCLVYPKIQKLLKILRHIESCGTCMKH